MTYVAESVRTGSIDVESDLAQSICQHEMRMDHIIRSESMADKKTQNTIQSLLLPMDKILLCIQAIYLSFNRR
jgi:hypothetical protein